MADKTDNRIQVRVPEGGDLEKWLTDRAERMLNGSVHVQARTELELWRHMLTAELRRLHPPLEWMNCIADVFTSSVLGATVGAAPGAIGLTWHGVSDAFRFANEAGPVGSYGAKWGLNEAHLLEWLWELGPAADHALRDAVSRWWETNQEATADGWAAVGVFILVPSEPRA